MTGNYRLVQGDALTILRTLKDGSVNCVITSPPYWGLRNYNHEGQMGLESTLEEYLDNIVAVFREVRRVLKKDGTLWLNLGDSYASTVGQNRNPRPQTGLHPGGNHAYREEPISRGNNPASGPVKPKDLFGIPWRVAFALQAAGWYLRQDIIFHKPNAMPESVKDRCTRAHEYLFLLTKSQRYHFDAQAISEPRKKPLERTIKMPDYWATHPGQHGRILRNGRCKGKIHRLRAEPYGEGKRNKRSVWTIPTEPCKEAHFATFPTRLVIPCVLAGSRKDDLVMDPFCGSGTVGLVALRLGRRFFGIELNPQYVALARKRIYWDFPLLNQEDASYAPANDISRNVI